MPFVTGTEFPQQFFAGDKNINQETFFAEIEAYGGLMGQHWSAAIPGWFLNPAPPVVFEFWEETPQGVIDGVLAVYAAHDPNTTPA